MRAHVFAVLSLFACGDTTTTTTEDAPDECAPKTLDLTLYSEIDICADATCNELVGRWHGLTPADTKYDLELAARCTVTDSFEPEPGMTRWIFTGCTGDRVADDGVLALTWNPSSSLSLPLNIGAQVELRYRAVADEFYYHGQYGWSLRDANDVPLAFHAAQQLPPESWLFAPIAVDISRTDCVLSMACGGTSYQERVEFRGDGAPVVVPDGNAGLFTHGSAVYDAFVFGATWGEGYLCGLYDRVGSYNLAFVAR
jgi:hypothetical protein